MNNSFNSLNLAEGMVSIIIPVYNAEKYLQRCVESAIGQTYANIEILLIDDGSTDDSGNLCDEYALNDRRIKVIHKKNGGPADARNVGIEYSRGESIFFVDSDDHIAKEALSVLIEGFDKSRADLVLGDFKIENPTEVSSAERGFIFPSDRELSGDDIVYYVRSYLQKPTGYSVFIYAWGKLFKAKILKENNVRFNTDFRVFEDIAFNFDYLKFVHSAYYIRRHLYNYIAYDNHTTAGAKIFENPVGFKVGLGSIASFLKYRNVEDSVVEKEIGNASVHFSIRVIMGLIANKNIGLRKLYTLLRRMVYDSDIRRALKFYAPTKGDSKIIPLLMRLRLVYPIIWVCRYKAYKRYRKASSVEK